MDQEHLNDVLHDKLKSPAKEQNASPSGGVQHLGWSRPFGGNGWIVHQRYTRHRSECRAVLRLERGG